MSRPTQPAVLVGSPRSRAWWWAGCAALLVLTYLVIWTVYSMSHLSAYARYDQLGAGGAARQYQAEFRLLSLVRAPELASTGGDSQVATPGAVWVVATLEVVQRAKDPHFLCSTELLGPRRRAWEPTSSLDVQRSRPQFCPDEDLAVGRPYEFEQVYEVPEGDAEQIVGVVVVNHLDARPNQVLTPPVRR